jgi:Holliday junction DNA helicase RuvA
MIVGLKGYITALLEESLGIDVNGVTYEVFVPQSKLAEIGSVGDYLHLHTHLRYTNDTFTIFGFDDSEQLKVFHQLISVNGVGPKNGLAILSHLSISQITEAVMTDNVGLLTGVPGVGTRTASRIALELKGKMEFLEGMELEITRFDNDSDLIDSLVALGYTITEVKSVIGKTDFDPDHMDLESRIKMVLSRMA